MTFPTTTIRIPAPGFGDPVHDAQQTFRAVLDALARPTRPVMISPKVAGPGSLTPAAAAVLLTLCDDSTALWLDDRIRSGRDDVEAWLAFHASAPVVTQPSQAMFAVVSAPPALPDLSMFAEGSDEAPHTSATIIVLDAHGTSNRTLMADGPGIENPTSWAVPAFPADFPQQWADNHARFPRGIDLIIAGSGTVVGLPRTTRLTATSPEVD